jgi:hypothetical protein
MEQVAILARVSTQGQYYERQVVELTDISVKNCGKWGFEKGLHLVCGLA